MRATPLAPSFYSLLKTNFNFDEVADHLDRDEEEAVALVVNGFCKEVLQALPMEFAMEAQSLVAISLEGSVG